MASALLASPNPEENVIAVLMRLGDKRAAVRRILARIAESEPGQRRIALGEFIILAGLRHLGSDNRRGDEDNADSGRHHGSRPARAGLRRGLQQGRVEGRVEGEQTVVMRQIEKRFGPVPAWARQRLEAMSAPELEETALRLLDARSLEELLGK